MRFAVTTTLLLLGAAALTHHRAAAQEEPAQQAYSGGYCKTPHFIVVGGGAAGCVVASRLSESGSQCVVLLEAGYDESTRADTQIILKPGHPIGVRAQGPMQWLAYSNETNGLGPTQNFQELYGRLLGGGTSINGADYTFPVTEDHNAGIFGNLPGWSYTDLLPLRVRSESYVNLDDPTQPIHSDYGQFRGTDGPIQVLQYPLNDYSKGVVNSMMTALNLPWNPDNNNYTSYGVSQLQINAGGNTVQNAFRQDTWTTYVKPHIGVRPNLKVITGARVTKILTKVNPSNNPYDQPKPVAYGVQYIDADGVTRTLLARREIILSAGSLHTPYILQLSGIGDSAYLSTFNIETVVDSYHVGRNFIDKVTFPFVITSNYTDVDWTQFTASYNSGTQPHIPSNLLDTTLIVQQVVNPANTAQMTVMGVMLYHSGVGRVGINHPNPIYPPLFHFGFFKNQTSDLALARQTIRNQRAIIAGFPAAIKAATGQTVTITEVIPGANLVQNPTDAQLNAYILRNHGPGFHGISSARMAATIEDGVVDEKLRVFGVSGLRVADISVLRVNAVGPTAAYAVVVGEKCADLIRQQYGF